MWQRPLRLGAKTQTKPNTGAKPAATDQKLCLTDMHPPTGQPRRGGPQHRRQHHRRQWLVDLLPGQGFDLGSHEQAQDHQPQGRPGHRPPHDHVDAPTRCQDKPTPHGIRPRREIKWLELGQIKRALDADLMTAQGNVASKRCAAHRSIVDEQAGGRLRFHHHLARAGRKLARHQDGLADMGL